MKASGLKSKLLFVALLVAACCLVVLLYGKVAYPYGHRGALLRSMYFALLNYASDHDGHFPSSEKGSYDALQRLYPQYTPSGVELAGISGNINAVVVALRNKTPLNQSLTSWVYVQGFKKDDDPNIAILWESQAGLYPNGKRNSFGGRAVLLIGGDITNVPASDWGDFLKQQEQLRKAVQSRPAAKTNPLQQAPR